MIIAGSAAGYFIRTTCRKTMQLMILETMCEWYAVQNVGTNFIGLWILNAASSEISFIYQFFLSALAENERKKILYKLSTQQNAWSLVCSKRSYNGHRFWCIFCIFPIFQTENIGLVWWMKNRNSYSREMSEEIFRASVFTCLLKRRMRMRLSERNWGLQIIS